MKKKGSLALMILVAHWWVYGATRDPFQPYVEGHCQPQLAEVKHWRFVGVVGRTANYRAWLLHEQNRQEIELAAGESVGMSAWRAINITPEQVRLSALGTCVPQYQHLYLWQDSDESKHSVVSASVESRHRQSGSR